MIDIGGTCWWYDMKSRGVWGPTMAVSFRRDGSVSVSLTEPNLADFGGAPVSVQAVGSFRPSTDEESIEIELDKPVRGRRRIAGRFRTPEVLHLDGLPSPLFREASS